MNYSKKIFIALILLLLSIIANAQRFHFSGGYFFSTYICDDNKLFTWGDSYAGELARDESICDYINPCEAQNVKNIISIDAGLGSHCLALISNKKVISWGRNFYGELGLGLNCDASPSSVCQKQIPDTVLGGETGNLYLENVKAIATGQSQSYALLETGEVLAWGDNSFGQLGDGTTIQRNEPVYVKTKAGIRLQNVIMIAAGASHAYALLSTGEVYSWGNNSHKQLACGNLSIQNYPQKVIDKNNNWITHVKKIEAGSNFGLLLLESGNVMGMGAYKGTDVHPETNTIIYKTNEYAELISGGETPNFYLENVIEISAGNTHSLAIVKEKNKNYVVSWGNNRFPELNSTKGGQLGTGPSYNEYFLTPHYVKRSSTLKLENAAYISAGSGVSYIEIYSENNENQFWVTGINSSGQLGTGNYFDQYYTTRIDDFLCNPICSGFNIGSDTTFCIPLLEDLKTGLSKQDHSFKWYKNGILLASQSDSILTVVDSGIYKVEVIDNSETCLPRESEISIGVKDKKFEIIYNSFCNSNLEFKLIGEGNFNWYSYKNGIKLGSGNYLSTSKFFTEEIITDSIYRVWVEHSNECQAMPISMVKNCNCNVSPPICIDTTACSTRSYFTRAIGDSIVWYKDSLKTNALHLGNFYPLDSLELGEHVYYASNIKNRCESSVDSSVLTLEYCDNWFQIAGYILEKNNGVSYTKVELYDNEFNTLDSCITSEDGYFLLFTEKDSVTIKAYAKGNYLNTWIGNKTTKENAHFLYADAYIGGIIISLREQSTAFNKLKKEDKDISQISVFTINGSIIGTTNNPHFENLCNTRGVYIVVLKYIDGSSESIRYIKK